MNKVLALLALLYAQQVEIGTAFTRQGYLQGEDTTFSLNEKSRVLAVKYTHPQNLKDDTLWVVVRSIKGTHGRFYMRRSRLRLQEANAYILLREPGIYLLLIYQKNFRRLAVKRFYVTSPQYPTLASLLRRRNQIYAQQKAAKSTPFADIPEENLEDLTENLTQPEPLSPKQIQLENIEEDITDTDSEIEEITVEDEEYDLIEDMELEDMEELEDL
ncbi:MAG: hypothetical protein ACUVRD_07365 [Bacteroidia bacterium]